MVVGSVNADGVVVDDAGLEVTVCLGVVKGATSTSGWASAAPWAGTRRSLSLGDSALTAAVKASTEALATKLVLKRAPSVWTRRHGS